MKEQHVIYLRIGDFFLSICIYKEMEEMPNYTSQPSLRLHVSS